jgi:outer membrane protein
MIVKLVSVTRALVGPGLLAVLLSVLSTGALAQEGIKIAVLDMSAALFNSEKAKEIDAQMRSETAEDQEKVRALAEEATKLQTKMEQDAAVMSDAEKRRATEQMQELGVQYQFLVQKMETLFQERREEFQNTYAPNLIQAITAVVEEGKYDMVLRAEVVLHYANTYDITARVTEKLNTQK